MYNIIGWDGAVRRSVYVLYFPRVCAVEEVSFLYLLPTGGTISSRSIERTAFNLLWWTMMIVIEVQLIGAVGVDPLRDMPEVMLCFH